MFCTRACCRFFLFFFFNDTATTEIYTLSLHDALPISPAGVEKLGTGHHHLLIDLAELPDLDTSLQATDQIKHFGGGQTETTLDLTPGEHTLQLVLGNYTHVPHDNTVISEKIKVTVE